jgi:tetratricopeptide (TPR) repeat protein
VAAKGGGLFDLTSLGSMIEEEEAGYAPGPALPPAAVSKSKKAEADALWDSTKPGLSVPSPATPPPASFEDSGVSWLDEADTAKPKAQRVAGLFDEEDDFFDLAGELVEELSKEEVFQDGVQVEQSLEEIVEGFKKGVAEHLSPTDYDTHFNLGIAYREMGLLDEAIGEFQLAAKDARYLVTSSSMLGLCFLDKGLPELSIKWYRRGMESPNLGEDDTLGLMYDLGNAYMALGDMSSAFATFVELYGINTNYRDVVAKIEELRK